MKSRIAKAVTIALAVIIFRYFVWPTPYVFTRHEGTVTRVNRFTGVEEHSTESGWVNPATEAAERKRRLADQMAEAEPVRKEHLTIRSLHFQ